MRSNPLFRLRKTRHLTQGELGERLGLSQQAISFAEQKLELSADLRQRLLEMYPEDRELIQGALEGSASGLSREDLRASRLRQQLPVQEPPPAEDEARAWSVNYRSDRLRDRMAHLAALAGFQPQVLKDIPYGLFIAPGSGASQTPNRLGDILFPHHGAFGVRSRTVVLFGSPYKHPFTSDLLECFSRRFLERCAEKFRLRFLLDTDLRIRRRYSYFGYPTLCNDLYIDGKAYRSGRYVTEDDAVCYEDYGAILHGPIIPLVDRAENPFPKDAAMVVLVAGNHRLATGAGAGLVENAELRSRILGEEYQFQGWGALAYRIVVKSGEFSTVEDFSVVRKWSSASQRVRRAEDAGRTTPR
jgi:transcriptional regulator with XRE-family HTH domain